jgi:hypothetical protein
MSKPVKSLDDAKARILADLRKVKGCEMVESVDVEHRGLGWFVTHVDAGQAEMPADKIFVEARRIAGRLS